jgi:hypothetical protein
MLWAHEDLNLGPLRVKEWTAGHLPAQTGPDLRRCVRFRSLLTRCCSMFRGISAGWRSRSPATFTCDGVPKPGAVQRPNRDGGR